MRKQIGLLFIMLLTISVLAITIESPVDHSNIQEGIDIFENGDEVNVLPGTFVENINLEYNTIAIIMFYINGGVFYEEKVLYSYISYFIA